MMKGLPDTGSHPAQMGIGFSYIMKSCLRSTMLCVSFARAHALMGYQSRWNVRGLAGSNLQKMTVGRPRQGATSSMEKAWGTIARYAGSICKINYRRGCRKYLGDKLSQGM
jgi:hypothetical protein